MKKNSFVLFFALIFHIAFAQNGFSQKKIYQLIDSVKHYYSVLPQKAEDLCHILIKEAKTRKSDSLLAVGYEFLGKSKYFKSEYDSAIFYLEEAKNIYKMLNNFGKEAELLEKIGSCYYSGKADFATAMKYYLKSLKRRELLGDTLGLAYLYNNIGNIYYKQNMREEARKNYEEALFYARKTNDKKILAIILNNLGSEYAYIKDYNKALDYYFQALELKKQTGNPISLAITYGSIGSIYKYKKDYEKAIKYYNIALNLLENKNQYYYALMLNYLSAVYKEKKNYQLTISYLKKSVEIAEKIKALQILESDYKALSEVYSLLGDYKNAYDYSKKYLAVHDSIFNKERNEALAELQMKYEVDKQLKENELLKKENQIKELNITKQKIKLRFAIVGATIFFISTLLIFFLYRYNRKLAKILNHKNFELEEANKQLYSSQILLKKEIETKNKFFSIIAHDLRNPLNILPIITENLAENYNSLNDKQKLYYINNIDKTTKSLSQLVENLLLWARAQSGRIKLNYETFKLNEIVSQNINLLALNAEKKNIRIENNIPEDVEIFSDKNILTTVIRNLLSNAIKFTPEGGKITFDLREQGDKYIVSVSDTGIGMSEDDLKKLFRIDVDPKSIGKSKEKGSGLGLIICKDFLNLTGEKIWVESTPGKGTTFYFTVAKK